MSTRSNVKLVGKIRGKEKVRWLYHHWDGYPSNMGPTIEHYMAYMQRLGIRGLDPTASQFIWLSGGEDDMYPEETDETTRKGFEHTTDMHGDIEWLYTVTLDGRSYTIQCQRVRGYNVVEEPEPWCRAAAREYLHGRIPYLKKKCHEAILDGNLDRAAEISEGIELDKEQAAIWLDRAGA